MSIGAFIGKNDFYTPVEYIESSGTQYIDTGIKPTNNTRVDMLVKFSNSASSSETLFCGRDLDSSGNLVKGFVLMRNSSGGLWNQYEATSTTVSVDPIGTSESYLFKKDKATLYVDDEIAHVDTYSSFTINRNMWLFASHSGANGATVNNYGSFKLYGCKIWSNGVLVRDFEPITNKDGVAGLLDKITKEFFFNKGTGTFTAGNATSEPISLDSKAARVKKIFLGKYTTEYTPVEYIESTGTQYIDTGVTPDQDFGYDIDFTPLDDTPTATKGPHFMNAGGSGSYGTANARVAICTYPTVPGASGELQLGEAKVDPMLSKGTRAHITLSNKVLTLNDGTTQTLTTSNFTSTNTLLVFAAHNGTVDRFSNMRLYSLKLYSGSTLIRDFIPVLDNNNVACLYDKVSNTYYRNSGSGTFAVGEVYEKESKARNVVSGYVGVREIYTPVEFIEGTGTQYIDTNYNPNNNTRVVFDFTPTSVTGTWAWPFGGRNAYHDADFTVAFNTSTWYSGYGGDDCRPTPAPTANTRYVVDKNKTTITINGTGYANTAATFQSDYSLLLLGAHVQRNRSRPL